MNESHESMQAWGPGVGDGRRLPNLTALTLLHPCRDSGPPHLHVMAYSDQLIHSASSDPCHRHTHCILQKIQDLRALITNQMFWLGVGTRFGSPNSNCIRPVGAKSQEVAKPSHFTLYSCINVRGHKKDVFVFSLLPFTLLLFLGICFFIIPDPTCRFLHVPYFHSLQQFKESRGTAEPSTGHNLDMGQVTQVFLISYYYWKGTECSDFFFF